MEGSIQTHKYGFTENSGPINIGFLYISYQTIWVIIFMERWVSISSFESNNVLYHLGQHSLDYKLFSFWK